MTPQQAIRYWCAKEQLDKLILDWNYRRYNLAKITENEIRSQKCATHSAAADTPASKQTRATKLNWDGKRCVCNEFYNCHDCRDFLAFNKEHDAAIRKDECDWLLDQLDAMLFNQIVSVILDIDSSERRDAVLYGDIMKVIESLRAGDP